MEGPMFAWLWNDIAREVRRVTSEAVFLVLDNAPSHEVLEADDATSISILHNTMLLYNSLDIGLSAAVQRRCMPRLLRLVYR